MSVLWVEIESLTLEGAALSAAKGERLARLTEAALVRLLAQRGGYPRLRTVFAAEGEGGEHSRGVRLSSPAGADEAAWAEELAMVLYRAMDRNS